VLDGYSDPDALTACEKEPACWPDVVGQPTGPDSRFSGSSKSRTHIGLGCELRALEHGVDRIAHDEPGSRINPRKWIGR
jgi:hypothetical protein